MGHKSNRKRIKLEMIPCELQNARYRQLAKEWFESNKKWCPLFGNLPESEIGEYNPSNFPWICINLIREARTLWDIYPLPGTVDKDGLDEYGKDPRKLLSSWPEPKEIPKYPSRILLEARKIFNAYGEIIDEAMRQPLPGQLPSDMWYHSPIDYPLYDDGAVKLIIKGARSTVGWWTVGKFIPDYAILAILTIHRAWWVLQSLILENQPENDSGLWKKTNESQGLLNHAKEIMGKISIGELEQSAKKYEEHLKRRTKGIKKAKEVNIARRNAKAEACRKQTKIIRREGWNGPIKELYWRIESRFRRMEELYKQLQYYPDRRIEIKEKIETEKRRSPIYEDFKKLDSNQLVGFRQFQRYLKKK